MNTKPVKATGLLVLVFGVTAAGAQNASGDLAASAVKKSEQQFKLCATNEKTESAERTMLETYSSPALKKATLSSKSFWDFITDPSTPYMDRLAAANRGGSMLSPEELPLLWQAMAEVSSVASGVHPPPCSAVAIIVRPLTLDALEPSLNRSHEEASRAVLGREIKLSTDTLSFPVTAEERNHSPWLWQMERTLSILFTKTNIYYGDAIRYPARVKAAWDWPIPASNYHPGEIDRNFELVGWNKIEIRSRALTEGAPHDVLFLQTILKLALNNDNYYVAYSSHVGDLYAWGQDSYHYEELAHIAQIAILQKTRWQNVAAQTAFVMASLAQQKGDPANVSALKPLKTATGILAIGRWAINKSINPWDRYYSFDQPICRMVNDAPCPPDQLRDPKDPRLDERLKNFEAWFENKKPDLEHQAESERPYLGSIAKELQTAIK
jgi:hypothetical protein